MSSVKWRSMFSSTTVESSTRMPMTSDIPSSEIVSIVRFISFIAVTAIASEVGIETQTTIALRHERRKNTIARPVEEDRLEERPHDDVGSAAAVKLRLDVDDVKVDVGELALDLRKRPQIRRSTRRLRWRPTPFAPEGRARAGR